MSSDGAFKKDDVRILLILFGIVLCFGFVWFVFTWMGLLILWLVCWLT